MSRIEANEVSKRYFDGLRRTMAVNEVSAAFEPGTLSVLVGPSGCGKSTLLGLLGGLVQPTSGEVVIDGESVTSMRDHHRIEFCRSRVGFVFQELSLIDGMSGLENVLLPFVPTGGATKTDLAHVVGALDRFGVADLAGSKARDLSGGQRQRIALVRALARQPRALLLDEPSAHLDGENTAAIMDLLVAERDAGRTVVVTTHDPRIASDARLDRCLEMAEGQLA